MGGKLGFGLMRLPEYTQGIHKGEINIDLVKQMTDLFLERGYTYFDTAYIYGDGASEQAFRQAVVNRYPRESYSITDKIPMMNITRSEEMQETVNTMLGRLGVQYFDYLWLHAISGPNWEKAKKFDSFSFLNDLKEKGITRHTGFSFHGSPELLQEVLEENPQAEYVQLQINYLDWNDPIIQAGKCYEICEKYHKKVIVMEPVKGGILAELPESVSTEFLRRDPNSSMASWAIRFGASLKNVEVVLSGMSNMEQVEDNTTFMDSFVPLAPEEEEMLGRAAETIRKNIAIPCTACRYCTAECPEHIAIPDYFAVYNTYKRFGNDKSQSDIINYYGYVKEQNGKPQDCVGCGNCENRCPQGLPIRKYLEEVYGALG